VVAYIMAIVHIRYRSFCPDLANAWKKIYANLVDFSLRYYSY
jgi:hypothetical protein